MATAVSVATSSTALLARNSARKGFIMQNPSTSGATVWVSEDGGTAVAASPCWEVASGGELNLTVGGSITAIAVGASATVTVSEYF
jgi:hypothetical protein